MRMVHPFSVVHFVKHPDFALRDVAEGESEEARVFFQPAFLLYCIDVFLGEFRAVVRAVESQSLGPILSSFSRSSRFELEAKRLRPLFVHYLD